MICVETIVFVVGLLLGTLLEFLFPLLLGIFSIGAFIFSLPLAIRRLHDIGKSGWYLLLGLIPFVGFIIILYFFVQDSQREQNQWGPSPKYGQSTDGFLPSETV